VASEVSGFFFAEVLEATAPAVTVRSPIRIRQTAATRR
jgi:hypothetical protein